MAKNANESVAKEQVVTMTVEEMTALIDAKVNAALATKQYEKKASSISYEGKSLYNVTLANGNVVPFHSQDLASAKYRAYRIARDHGSKIMELALVGAAEAPAEEVTED